jgi:hypothetical protein
VNTESGLQNAVSNLQSGQTIVIQKGTYNLSSTLYIGLNHQVSNVVIRGATDNERDVALLGQGMENANYGNVPFGFAVYNAQNVTIADLSIGNIYYDPIELQGSAGADSINVYHDYMFDAGEQFVKSNPNTTNGGVSGSAVQYSTMLYTVAPPVTDHGGGSGYTNGVDVHGGTGWTVSNNLFQNFHTPDSSQNLWNPAVLFWNHSANNLVEGNTFINTDRAIAFGLVNNGYLDCQGGSIVNNFVYLSPGLFSAARTAASDGQIIVWNSPGTSVLHNTLLTNGNVFDSIQLRFASTVNIPITNNLADAPLGARDSSSYVASGNYLAATASMFVNPAAGDLHLVSNSATQSHVIDQVTAPASVTTDWDGDPRPGAPGTLSDIGADEYVAAVPGPTVVSESPAPNATSVPANTTVTATFDKSIQPATLSFTLTDASNQQVAATVVYNDATHTATLTPSASLPLGNTYRATVSNARDLSGNPMSGPFSWTFSTVSKGASAVALASSANPAAPFQPVTFTATVTAVVPATGLPTGSVSFKDGATTLGTAPLSGGTASLTVSSLALGSHAITAVYGGDANFTGNTSATLTQTIAGPFTGPISVTGAGAGGGPEVKAIDPKTGTVLLDFMAYDPAFRGGVRVAVADVNGDGVPDIITAPGPGGGPDIRVSNGTTGAIIREFMAYSSSFTGGVYVAAGDVNGDGFADIVTGADAGGGPHVEVFSGKDGSLIKGFMAYSGGFKGGVRVAVADVDGDGKADVITAPGAGGGPHIRVFSGATFSILEEFMAYSTSFTGGVHVAAGDTNGDGKADIITGAGAGGGPEVKVFSGANHSVLKDFMAYSQSYLGGVRVGYLGDINGDGKGDLLIAPGQGLAPQVSVYDGATLAALDSYFAYDQKFTGGVYVGGH